ncbi:flagellar hook protein FlgE [Thioalkalivibrio denitrificans]|uniref:Flagellar hook protein FlgE n=1 Tax=Thioalkalivibrio denitrificans TaxID=108003 RepID=A0A1V3NQ09_9GAMM|nr:flagellar hook protein FlgE [Thioalkalivibrio denitrificans]OOG27131.1 flagellar hook protein FlgE [Thioalkalivibrio denitrificans]
MPFRTALSGLNAASADLRVTGNNIANTSTVGFKESRAEFADVFSLSYGGISQTAIGSGVRLSAVTQQFGQGNIDFTGNNLDLAMNGQGFFVLSDSGTRVYSRAGAFQVNRDGHVVNAQGQRLQVYPPQNPQGTQFNTGTLSDLQLSTSEAPPQATSEVDTRLNLSSEAEVITDAFEMDNPNTFNFSTSLTVYDSLGQTHTATLYFQKTDSLEWNTYLSINGELVPDTVPATAEELTFNSDGSLATPTTPLNFGTHDPQNGADPLNIDFDLSNATQYGGTFNVTSLSQDGFSTGRLNSIDIDSSGVVFARYTNGQSEALGKVALANFANPQGLQQLGDNAWGESFAAGDVILGQADTGNFGTIQAGGLETANVDIAEQLVKMITAQRNFQANAQVITTADSITQTIINIR